MTLGTVAILGPGLIGGSLALALAERGLADELVVYARSPRRALDAIRTAGLNVELTDNPSEAVREADVVILCVPIEAMAGLVNEIRDALKPTALVTDVGSVKGSVVRDLEPLLDGRALWIGSHPMAGSEQTGFSAARADLFEGAAVVITPTRQTPPEAERRVEEFWRALGGRVIKLAPHKHDDLVAQISHLPHLVAAALAARVSDDAIELAGGGFRDTTRVASGSPDLWVEIISANAAAMAQHLDFLIRGLEKLRDALASGSDDAKSVLRANLKAGHDARLRLPQKRPKNP
jgi:prephenate dehydrogenase